MGSLNKAKRIDLINLCEECGIEPSEKATIPILIKLIKSWEDYDEDFIKDRLEVIMAARKEKAEEEREREEKKLRAEIEENKLKAQSELEEKKLKMEMEERKWRIELEEKDREREFEIKKIQLQENSRQHIDVDTRTNPVLAPTPEPQCTLLELHQCLQSLQTQSNDLAFAATRHELLALCSTMKKSMSCVDNHMKHCFTPTQRKVFNHVVAAARQVLLELCVPGPIQEAYLRHAPCFKNVSLSEDKCAPKYRYLMQLSENVNRRQNVDDGLRESCCAFGEFVTCKYLHVSQDCGLDAAKFLQQHLDRISSPLIHEHCAQYNYESDACLQVSGLFKTQSVNRLLLFFGLVINFLCVLTKKSCVI